MVGPMETAATGDVAARLAEVARQTSERGLNQGRTGNASVRVAGGCAITPSGLELAHVLTGDLVPIDLDGNLLVPDESRVASSEWRLHTEIYRARPEVGAVVHCHSIAATGISALRVGIPAFHYMVPALGGADIRCTGYAIYGSAALAAEAVRALEGRMACLLANHGVVACGTTPEDALEAAIMVEALAAQYLAARQLGEPVLLTSEQIDELIAGFLSYRAVITGPVRGTGISGPSRLYEKPEWRATQGADVPVVHLTAVTRAMRERSPELRWGMGNPGPHGVTVWAADDTDLAGILDSVVGSGGWTWRALPERPY